MEQTPKQVLIQSQGAVFVADTIGNIIATTNNRLPPVAVPINFGVWKYVANFTGRTTELRKLKEAFSQESNSSATVIVSGLGGIGKTQCVRKFIADNRSTYENVACIIAESTDLINDSFKSLAFLLDIKTSNADDKEKYLTVLIQEVLNKLCQQKTLLIYDNVNDIENIKYLLMLKPSGKTPNIVITSRIQEFSEEFVVIPLKEWSISDAKEYVTKVLLNPNDPDEDIELLVRKLQFFPLALRQATSYIKHQRKNKKLSISDYVKKCHTKEMLNSNIFQTNTTDLYKMTTFTTWIITIETIQQEEECGQLAVGLLYVMAYFASDNIHRDFFKALRNDFRNQEDFEERLLSAVSLLINYSMIDGQDAESILNIHRLVQEVIKLTLIETHQEKTILQEALLLTSKLIENQLIHSHAISVFLRVLYYTDLVVIFKTLPIEILHYIIINGKYRQAIEFGNKIVDPLTDILKDVDMLQIKVQIARAYVQQGFHTDALKMNKEIFEKQICIFGEDHPETLATSSNIATSHVSLGNYTEALKLHKEIFQKKEASLGKDHPYTLTTKLNIANSYVNLGNYSEALKLQQQIFEKRKLNFGDAHSDTLTARSNIAISHARLGNYSEALKLHQEILEKLKTILDVDHPDTLATRSHIANSHANLGNYSEALKLLQEIFEKQTSILGEDHPHTLTTRSDIASCYAKLGNSTEALRLHEEILERRKNNFGEEHPYTLLTKSNIAHSHANLGNNTDALKLYQEIFDKQKTILGENHPYRLIIGSDLARTHTKLRNYKEALKLYQEIFEKRHTILGENHPHTLKTRSHIAFLNSKLAPNRLIKTMLRILFEVILMFFAYGEV